MNQNYWDSVKEEMTVYIVTVSNMIQSYTVCSGLLISNKREPQPLMQLSILVDIQLFYASKRLEWTSENWCPIFFSKVAS